MKKKGSALGHPSSVDERSVHQARRTFLNCAHRSEFEGVGGGGWGVSEMSVSD